MRQLFARAALVVSALALVATVPALAAWDPQAFTKEQTLEFLTVEPGGGEHWSTVWLVVIDGQLYTRLGGRAAGRIEANTTKPLVKLRIAGQEFANVTAEATPDQAAAVAAALHEKYWSDVFVQYFNHPLTMRLVPAKQGM